MNHPHFESYMPHGACWLWNPFLILLHASADLLTFLAYAAIPLTAVYIYRSGHLRGLAEAYPSLWRLGGAFVFFCGLCHLGSFLEVWFGGGVYWITGVNKAIMATVSLWFAYAFWKCREDLVLIGRLLEAATRGRRTK